jgi:DNA processing protein
MSHADAYLRLALIPGLGPVTAQRLLDEAGGDAAAVFGWSMARLQSIEGVGAERARRICDPAGAEAVVAERALCHGAGVTIVTRADPGYPQAFLRLSDPPLAVWMQGALEERDRLAIAVVGPRRPSAYGHRQATRFAGQLARIGTCIVSGLARGVDTVAHQAALDADGRTIAVLGSGFGKLYPEENRELAARIAAGHGAVLSELPFNMPPSQGTFPRRNRLVAALSLATLVVEAGATSGALITARLSAEMGREVLVIPGSIDNPECVGSNQLLRDGATLVTTIDHVLEEIEPLAILAGAMAPAPAESPRAASLSGREKQVYSLLDDTARPVDELVRISQLPPSAVSTTLLSLELRRLARKTPGGYVRAT